MNLGKQLKELREERNLSLKDVADALHMAKSTISEYENNNIDPPTSRLMSLLDFYNVEPIHFLKTGEQYINISKYSENGKNKAIILDLEERNIKKYKYK
ncbi:MAG: helix-turn-helix domain-containing protein [Faecalibacillus sp.]